MQSCPHHDGSAWDVLYEIYFDLLGYVIPGGLCLVEGYWVARTAGLLRRGLFVSYMGVWPVGFVLAFLAAAYAMGVALNAVSRPLAFNLLRLAPPEGASFRSQEAALRVRSRSLRYFLAKRHALEVSSRNLSLIGLQGIGIFALRYLQTQHWVDLSMMAGTAVFTLALFWQVRDLRRRSQRDVAALAPVIEAPVSEGGPPARRAPRR